jgi:PAS domain S-box-containing protein
MGDKLNILIAEDEHLVANDIKGILENFGYHVSSVAFKADEVIKEVETNTPDLILIDIKLKGERDGIDAVEHIHNRFDIPFIYITALADKETLHRAKKTDPSGYIYKPIEEKELIANIEMALYKHSMLKKIKESERKYRNLFEMSKDAIYITRDEIIVDVNQAFLDLFGTTKTEIIGTNIRNRYISPEDMDKVKGKMEEQGFVKDFEVRLEKKDGTGIDCTTTTFLRRGKERSIAGIQGIIRDNTKQKKLQNQLIQSEKMAAIGTLTSGFAHEFNNLIQIMRGYTEFAHQTKKIEDMTEALEVVLKISDKSSDIIKDLLSFSSNKTIQKEKADIVEIMESVLSLIEDQLEKMNIKIEREYEELPAVEVNKGEIQQVFLNIINNARDAMMPKGGKLEVNIKKENDNALISIKDTGRGIKKNEMMKLFEPFYTTKREEENEFKGTGLGLSVSYAIVKRHKGRIEVESEEGKWSVFTIKIPIKSTKEEKARVIDKSKERKNLRALNILAVDDEEEIDRMLEKWISWEGHEVTTVNSGRKAISQVKKTNFDIIFLDLVMPGISGEETLIKIKKISPKTKIIIMTGKLKDTQFLEELVQKGADSYIRKPFSIKEIIDNIKKSQSI